MGVAALAMKSLLYISKRDENCFASGTLLEDEDFVQRKNGPSWMIEEHANKPLTHCKTTIS